MYKKFAGLFLFISFQAQCMMMVNQLPKKKKIKISAASVNHFAHRFISVQNYVYNEPFFQNKMIPDVQPIVMGNLDHRSNIQFIKTSKHLYDQYAQKGERGEIKYLICLFTKYPFQFSLPVDFNVYFDCYNRALFHYASQHESQTNILLSIEDKIVNDARAAMLKKCKINDSDPSAVMNFYRQQFAYDQYHRLVKDPVFFQAMLKRGVSPNADIEGMSLMSLIIFNRKNELLKIFLEDSWIDMNARDKNGMTALHIAATWNIKALEILLNGSRVDPNIQDKHGWSVLHNAVSSLNIKAAKILLSDPRVNPNAQDKDGYTVFHNAASWSNIDVLKILLDDSRVDFSIRTKKGFTILHTAVSGENIDALKILLDDPRIDPNSSS